MCVCVCVCVCVCLCVCVSVCVCACVCFSSLFFFLLPRSPSQAHCTPTTTHYTPSTRIAHTAGSMQTQYKSCYHSHMGAHPCWRKELGGPDLKSALRLSACQYVTGITGSQADQSSVGVYSAPILLASLYMQSNPVTSNRL